MRLRAMRSSSRPAKLGFIGAGGGALPIHPLALVDMNYAAGVYFGKQLADLSVTRALTSYAETAAGVWSSFGSHVARITDKGLLVEGARTNGIRNNSMQGAVAGSPGTLPTNWGESLAGLTRQVIGSGVENGIEYVDIRLSGTTTNVDLSVSFDSSTGIPALTGQTWFSSFFMSIVSGDLTNISAIRTQIVERTLAGSVVASGQSSDFKSALTASMARFSFSRLTSGGATVERVQPRMQMQFASGVSIDITLRIGWPQLEQGSFITSPIRTTGASVTRPADVILLPVPAFPTEYSLFAQLIPVVPTSTAAAQNIIQADAGSDTQRYVIRRNGSSGALLSSLVGGTGGAFAPAVTLAADQPYKIAGAVAAGSQACSVNGGSPGTASAAVLPTLPTQIRIGCGSATSENFNGYIRRVALISARLSNAELQALTV